MSNRLLLLLTTVLVDVAIGDPQILVLKTFRNGSTKAIDNVEDGANLYLAANDKSDYFQNIQVTTGGVTQSLSGLISPNSDGTPKKIQISGGLTVTSTNADSITDSLTGYLYITTAKQAQDPLFNVYVITGTHHITMNGVQSTTVVLNTQLTTSSGDSDQPQKTTYVTGIQQSSNEELLFRWGIPSANYSTADSGNKFFENPTLPNDKVVTRKFFDNVEPLQIGLDYWYITSTGSISMTLQNNYVSSHNYNATAVNTTGLIISSNNLYSEHVVNFQLDPTRGRTIGTIITPIITRQVKVNFIFVDAAGGVLEQTFNNTQTNTVYMTSQLAAQKLIVNATDIFPGVFYCQYYGFSTGSLPSSSTTQSSPVTKTLATTTQTASQTTGTSQASSSPASSTSPNTGSTTTVGTSSPAGNSTAAPSQSPSSTTVISTTSSSRSVLISDLVMSFVVVCAILF